MTDLFHVTSTLNRAEEEAANRKVSRHGGTAPRRAPDWAESGWPGRVPGPFGIIDWFI
jgi:hypothetical protein